MARLVDALKREDYRVWALTGVLLVIFLLHIPLSVALFDVRYDHTLRTVALGGALLGLVSGVLGTFAVLRRESLVGDALSHAALPGVAVAFLVAGRELIWLLVGAGIAGWVGAHLIATITQTTRLKRDAAMGIVLAAFFALGLALLSYIQGRPDASQAGLDQFIFGQAAAMVRDDVILIAGVGAVTLSALVLFWKEFKLLTFDPEFATANGYPTRLLGMLLSSLIVVAIVLGLQLAGVILMVGMLIAPAVAARQWTNRLGQMVVLAGVFGAFAGASGSIISATGEGLPTGPLIIVVAFINVFVAIAVAPGRGVVWMLVGRWRDRRRFAAQNILRDVYDHALRHDDPVYPAPEGMLVALRGGVARVGLRQLAQDGLLSGCTSDGWQLTDSGVRAAQHDAHNRRLWLVYREYGQTLGLPVIPEDRQRDIARWLTPDAVQRLEAVLDRENEA